MIFYFSATGNSKYVAQRIAKVTGEKIVSIMDCSLKKEIAIPEGEKLGIVSPVYCGGLPYHMAAFLEKAQLQVSEDTYLYFVATCGGFTGRAGDLSSKYLKKNVGRAFDAVYSVTMPDSFTPMFDASDKEKIEEINRNAEDDIDQIIECTGTEIKGNLMLGRLPKAAEAAYPVMYKQISKTKNFYVEDTCIGCGLCVEKCPSHAIVLEDGKPVWKKEHCAMCLGCLHRCPNFAIQYGKNTKKHGQYLHPGVEL